MASMIFKILNVKHLLDKILYKIADEWYIAWRVTTSGISSDNEWQRVVQRVIMNDNEWQRMMILANFSFFQIREEPTTKHLKKNSLNLKLDLWRGSIELRAETSP